MIPGLQRPQTAFAGTVLAGAALGVVSGAA
jgi:hypothetical protein